MERAQVRKRAEVLDALRELIAGRAHAKALQERMDWVAVQYAREVDWTMEEESQ
jgi:hypothetical protein